jgi:glycosyltransferase involved in cell wall biosynthesis
MAERSAVSVVLAVRNQADHIVPVIDSYVAALALLDRPFEIILVENESEDDSLRLCRELAERHPSVSVIHNERRGVGRAVRAGVAVARGDTLCYTNSAYTTSANLRGAIELYFENPGCLINTVRENRYPLRRRAGSRLFNAECRALFGFQTQDVNGTPKVFSRALFDQLVLNIDGSLFDVEFFLQSTLKGARIIDMRVPFTPRFGGKSGTNLQMSAKLYAGAFLMWLDFKGTQWLGKS